ncbi:hypothetical protein QQ045_024132 [Rhodiola kirilowii]
MFVFLQIVSVGAEAGRVEAGKKISGCQQTCVFAKASSVLTPLGLVSAFRAFFFAILPILTQATPFNFIKNLKRSQKGDQVKGVAHLKKYLQHFGYLNYPFGLESHAYDDDFDDFLEDAVRTQTNFQINTTGTLDDDTIRTMLKTAMWGS